MGVNALWLFICIYAYFVVSPIEFYIAAGCVGMVMGGIQALSRSTYAKLMPETQDATSFFSFYDVSEKIGIVIGTFIYGVLAQGSGDLRNGIIMFGVFFLLGGLMLRRVK
jgi:UMF1 family MFS transporter